MTVGLRAPYRDLLLPLGVLASLVAVDMLLPPSVIITGSFAMSAFVASALNTPAGTVVIALAATVMAAVSAAWNQDFGTPDWWVRVTLTLGFGGLAVVLSLTRVRREEALHRMSVIAESTQRALLRVLPARLGSVNVATRYVSATEAASVGGDLYEVADTPYGVRLIVGDVRGKGLEAVHMAATVVAGFRRVVFLEASLAKVAVHLDAVVTAVADDEDFVTAVLIEFHDDSSISVVNCGHPPPLLIRPSGRIETIGGESQPPLGLHPTVDAVVSPCEVGDRVLLYTDGLIETRDAHNEFFPLDRVAGDLRHGELDQALDRLHARLMAHARHRILDDVALVLTECTSPNFASAETHGPP